jgi:hypothetical protein
MAMLEEPIKGVKEVKNYISGEWVGSKGKIIVRHLPRFHSALQTLSSLLCQFL